MYCVKNRILWKKKKMRKILPFYYLELSYMPQKIKTNENLVYKHKRVPENLNHDWKIQTQMSYTYSQRHILGLLLVYPYPLLMQNFIMSASLLKMRVAEIKGTDNIPVIYCCAANYHNTCWFRTLTTFILLTGLVFE